MKPALVVVLVLGTPFLMPAMSTEVAQPSNAQLASLWLGLAPVPTDDEAPSTKYDEDAEAQKRALDVFRAVCTGYCHSTSAKVQREAPYLFDCEYQHGGSDQEVFDVVYNGVPDTQMQSFGGQLPDDDIWKVVSFLRVRSSCGDDGDEAEDEAESGP